MPSVIVFFATILATCAVRGKNVGSRVGFLDSSFYQPLTQIAVNLRKIQSAEVPQLAAHLTADKLGEDEDAQQLLKALRFRVDQIVPVFRQIAKMLSNADPNFYGKLLGDRGKEQASAFEGLHMADLVAAINNIKLLIQQAHGAVGRLVNYHESQFGPEGRRIADTGTQSHGPPEEAVRSINLLNDAFAAALDLQKEAYDQFARRNVMGKEKAAKRPLTLAQHFILKAVYPIGEKVFILRRDLSTARQRKSQKEEELLRHVVRLLKAKTSAVERELSKASLSLQQRMASVAAHLEKCQTNHHEAQRLEDLLYYLQNTHFPREVLQELTTKMASPFTMLNESERKLKSMLTEEGQEIDAPRNAAAEDITKSDIVDGFTDTTLAAALNTWHQIDYMIIPALNNIYSQLREVNAQMRYLTYQADKMFDTSTNTKTDQNYVEARGIGRMAADTHFAPLRQKVAESVEAVDKALTQLLMYGTARAPNVPVAALIDEVAAIKTQNGDEDLQNDLEQMHAMLQKAMSRLQVLNFWSSSTSPAEISPHYL